jgi:hypothetical protein
LEKFLGGFIRSWCVRDHAPEFGDDMHVCREMAVFCLGGKRISMFRRALPGLTLNKTTSIKRTDDVSGRVADPTRAGDLLAVVVQRSS